MSNVYHSPSEPGTAQDRQPPLPPARLQALRRPRLSRDVLLRRLRLGLRGDLPLRLPQGRHGGAHVPPRSHHHDRGHRVHTVLVRVGLDRG